MDTSIKELIGNKSLQFILKNFPIKSHEHMINFVNKFKENRNYVCLNGRQMGKTSMQINLFLSQLYDSLEISTFIKKFYLRSGTFNFIYYFRTSKCELVKVKGKWAASNLEFVLNFLERRGAKREDILEIEKIIFERS